MKSSAYALIQTTSAICGRRSNGSSKLGETRPPPRSESGNGLPRACGADDEKPNRTPSAWMISPSAFLPSHIFSADQRILFQAWVNSTEHYWETSGKPRSLDARE